MNVDVGGVAQMVERSLSMREVLGSIPGASNHIFEPRQFGRIFLHFCTFYGLNKRSKAAKPSVGGVAQMVERSLSMREVPGSIPGASNTDFFPH